MARLQHLTAVLAESRAPAEWTALALREAVSAVEARGGGLELISDDGARLELAHAVDPDTDPSPVWQTQPLRPGMPAADAILERRPIPIGSPDEMARLYPHLADIAARGSCAWVCLPLITAGRPHGALGFTFSEPREFTDDDILFMQTVAAQCGLAVDRARLMEREHIGHAEAELIHAVAASAAGQTDVAGILAAAVERLQRLIPFTGGSIALVEDDVLTVRAATGSHSDVAPGQSLARTGDLAWQVVEHGRPVLVNDTSASGPTFPRTSMRAYMAVPLAWDDRRIGLLEVHADAAGVFATSHLDLLAKIAVTVSRSVELARLYVAERAAREQLNAILAGVADGVIVQTADHRIIYANEPAARQAGFPSVVEYLGADPGEISRRLQVLDEVGQPFSYADLPARRALRGEFSPEMVVQFKRMDSGAVRWSLTRSRAVRGPHGELLAISIFHDITDQVRSEERLRFLADASARVASSLDVDETLSAVVDLAVHTLADWAVVCLVDNGAVDDVRVAQRAPADPEWVDQFRAHVSAGIHSRSHFWDALDTRQTANVPDVMRDLDQRQSDDTQYQALAQRLGLRSALFVPLIARDRVLGVMALFTSDSARTFEPSDQTVAEEVAQRAALALDNARLYRQAQNAIRARDEFLSIASHELRTPVTAISGVAQLLQRNRRRGTLDDERLDRALTQIGDSSVRLAVLTEDLLDVSRLQTGQFDLRLAPTDVVAFVADVVDRTRALAGRPGRHPIDFQPALQRSEIPIDPARMEQVLANLLSNAVKYSPDGGVIEVRLGDSEGGVQIDVKDAGIGLPPGAEEAIFEPFGRGSNALDRQIGGLGLGLYICRQIVQRHGGRIWATSAGDGAGTTMHVWLPRD